MYGNPFVLIFPEQSLNIASFSCLNQAAPQGQQADAA